MISGACEDKLDRSLIVFCYYTVVSVHTESAFGILQLFYVDLNCIRRERELLSKYQ